MPDTATIAGGPGDVADGLPTNPNPPSGVTVDSSRNAKPSNWTELIPATAYESSWLIVRIERPLTTGGGFLIDIGIGAVGSEQVLVPNLWQRAVTSTAYPSVAYLLPIRIPRGVRVSARGQYAVTGTVDIQVMAQTIATPITAPPALNRCEACGVNSAGVTLLTPLADPGATPNTDGAWTQLIAATTFAYRWMCLAVTCADTSIAADTRYLIDLAVGGSGQERLIFSDLAFYATAVYDDPRPSMLCFPVAIASGSRIAARAQCTVGTTGDRVPSMAVWGVG